MTLLLKFVGCQLNKISKESVSLSNLSSGDDSFVFRYFNKQTAACHNNIDNIGNKYLLCAHVRIAVYSGLTISLLNAGLYWSFNVLL